MPARHTPVPCEHCLAVYAQGWPRDIITAKLGAHPGTASGRRPAASAASGAGCNTCSVGSTFGVVILNLFWLPKNTKTEAEQE